MRTTRNCRIGTTQSAIARLESGGISPSLSMLRRYAAATGTRLHMELLPEGDTGQ
ncbi:MAG: helix-turn-helix domain-containing protein [Rhizobiaceae bacterium]